MVTTTTIPVANIEIEVAVYDDFNGGDIGDSCETGSSQYFYFVTPGTSVRVTDASTGQVLGLAQLGKGVVAYEETSNAEISESDARLFKYCAYVGEVSGLPLDRPFYVVQVEGDDVLGDGVTYSGDDVRNDRYIGVTSL